MVVGCLIAIIAFVFFIVLAILILAFTGITVTFAIIFRLLAKLLFPFILIGLGIKLIVKNRR